jgi:hypothetical protein
MSQLSLNYYYQKKSATTDEWVKKMWHLYTMKVYSATKKNEILSLVGKWMELENIILSEASQTQKAKSCMFSYVEYKPKINAAVLWDAGHTKGKSHKGGIE